MRIYAASFGAPCYIGAINMKIEATGNTKEQAENELANKVAYLKAQANYRFGDIAVYGNFELGYKLVQEYWTAI